MPYSKSTAIRIFNDVVSYYIKQSRFASLKKNSYPHDIQQCVYRTAIFQSSAALEEYVFTIFEDWIHLSHKNNEKIDKMPDELIAWVCGKKQKSVYDRYLIENNEKEFISKLANMKIHERFKKDALTKDIIKLNESVSDRKYPSKKNLKALFYRFGIDNIFHRLNSRGRKDYEKILKSFSDKRTEIAHNYPSPDLTFKDVNDLLLSINDFANTTDRVLWSHIVNISGIKCWKNSAIVTV